MKTKIHHEPAVLTVSKQDVAAIQMLASVIYAIIAANILLIFIIVSMSSERLLSTQQSVPPSLQLLLLFYFAGLLYLLSAVFWVRSKLADTSSLQSQDFRQQIFISYGLANVNQYLGFVWFFLGGAFLTSLPLMIIPPLFTLLVILPVVLKRAVFLKQHNDRG